MTENLYLRGYFSARGRAQKRAFLSLVPLFPTFLKTLTVPHSLGSQTSLGLPLRARPEPGLIHSPHVRGEEGNFM